MIKPSLKSLARNLRRCSTEAEREMWNLLHDRSLSGYKFRRQQPLGSYIMDFFCWGSGLVVELDGGQHADCEADRERTAFLESRGYRVLRFWNHEFLEHPEVVLMSIQRVLGEMTPHPTLSLGERNKRERNKHKLKRSVEVEKCFAG